MVSATEAAKFRRCRQVTLPELRLPYVPNETRSGPRRSRLRAADIYVSGLTRSSASWTPTEILPIDSTKGKVARENLIYVIVVGGPICFSTGATVTAVVFLL